MEIKKKKQVIPKVTPKDIEVLRNKLVLMDWCDIAQNLMTLEAEYVKVKKHLNTNQATSFRKLIAVYSNEKVRRMREINDSNPSSFYGPGQATAYWIDDEILLQ